jgi:hypothetical protein
MISVANCPLCSGNAELKGNRRKETQREHAVHEEVKFNGTKLQTLPGQENIDYIERDKGNCQADGYLNLSLYCNHSLYCGPILSIQDEMPA